MLRYKDSLSDRVSVPGSRNPDEATAPACVASAGKTSPCRMVMSRTLRKRRGPYRCDDGESLAQLHNLQCLPAHQPWLCGRRGNAFAHGGAPQGTNVLQQRQPEAARAL